MACQELQKTQPLKSSWGAALVALALHMCARAALAKRLGCMERAELRLGVARAEWIQEAPVAV